MATSPFPFLPPEPAGPTTQFPATRSEDRSIAVANAVVSSIIDQPRTGEFKREMLTWRTPHLGYVKMYINPKSISIEDRKELSTVRTKGGFVIQYAGESLTTINISGTTGSSGIEGINILYSIFRSEHDAFEGVAIALDEKLSALQFDTVLNTANSSSRFDLALGALDVVRGNGRPMPTLASLAANIEMYFQGVVYRGYFKSMRVDEAGDTAGLFNYTIVFEAYGKQGVRRNFTSWHKQPYVPAAPQANPYSFKDLINPVEITNVQYPTGTLLRGTGLTPEENNRIRLEGLVAPRDLIDSGKNKRITNVAIGNDGINIANNNLANRFRG